MKVYRVTITTGTTEQGVVFEIGETENQRSGRAIVTLPKELCDQVLAAGQRALEEAASKAVDESHGITAELHRLRTVEQEKERAATEAKALAEKEAAAANQQKASLEAEIAVKQLEKTVAEAELADVNQRLAEAKAQDASGGAGQ